MWHQLALCGPVIITQECYRLRETKSSDSWSRDWWYKSHWSRICDFLKNFKFKCFQIWNLNCPYLNTKHLNSFRLKLVHQRFFIRLFPSDSHQRWVLLASDRDTPATSKSHVPGVRIWIWEKYLYLRLSGSTIRGISLDHTRFMEKLNFSMTKWKSTYRM